MLYLTCTMISSVDIAHYGVAHAKDWVSVDCGTIQFGYISYFSSYFSRPCYLKTLVSQRQVSGTINSKEF